MKRAFQAVVILLVATVAFQFLGSLSPLVDWFFEQSIWIFMGVVQVALVFLCFKLKEFEVDTNQLLQKLLEQSYLTNKKLYDIEQALSPTVRANVIEIWTTKNGVKKKVDNMLGKIGEVYDLECAPKYDDGAGNLIPAKIDGLPRWSVTDELLAKLEVDPDNGFKARLTLLAEGAFVAQAACDADRGEGEKIIVGEVAFEVAGPEATVIAVSVTKVEA